MRQKLTVPLRGVKRSRSKEFVGAGEGVSLSMVRAEKIRQPAEKIRQDLTNLVARQR